MPDVFDFTALERWRSDPVSFIEEVLIDPETNKPFVLLPAERAFLQHAFKTDEHGRLLYPDLLYSCPKKSGKTAFAAIVLLTIIWLYGGSYPEAVCCANDLDQAQGRVFAAVRRIVEASPLLKREVAITQNRITFPATGATISAIDSGFAGAAGGNQNISVFDEVWAYTSERSRRLWDELVPPPTRKVACRLCVTYAGFEGESVLLQEMYKRGLQQEPIGTDLYAGDGLLMFWTHEPIAPWQTQSWIAQMRRSLRPNQFLRMIEKRFVTSEAAFVPMDAWDRCINPNQGQIYSNRATSIYVGVDASVKHDSSAIVACNWNEQAQQVRLVFHRIFQPSPEEPLNFEQTIERTLLDLSKRFNVVRIIFDPFQMVATAQRLTQAGLCVEEFPQSPANLTAASQNLFELINAGNLVAYPDAQIRLAMSRAIAVETSRGWRIAKEKQSHKIDVVIALGMSALAAVRHQPGDTYLPMDLWLSNDADEVVDLVPQPPKRLFPTLTDEQLERISQPLSTYGQRL